MRMDLKKKRTIMWSKFIGSECEQLADSCEHCNEPVSLINLENLTRWECISSS